jgi:GMP synthase (glutamine-hydrolysing)
MISVFWSIFRTGFPALALTLLCAYHVGAAGNVTPTSANPPQAKKQWLLVGLSPEGASGGSSKLFSVIKELSGNPNGVMLHFSKVNYDVLADLKPEFIILSPQGTPWCRYTGEMGIALQNFLWMLPLAAEEMNIPMLGICGGHQALALAFGGKVGPIRAGEDDCMPYTKERQRGVVPLTLTAQDPIFEGLNNGIKIVESHFDEVKVMPPGFVRLASEKISPNQIMRHPTRPVYGIQGHPEYFSANRPETGVLIKNFLKIAGNFGKVAGGKNADPKRGLASLHTRGVSKSPN